MINPKDTKSAREMLKAFPHIIKGFWRGLGACFAAWLVGWLAGVV